MSAAGAGVGANARNVPPKCVLARLFGTRNDDINVAHCKGDSFLQPLKWT